MNLAEKQDKNTTAYKGANTGLDWPMLWVRAQVLIDQHDKTLTWYKAWYVTATEQQQKVINFDFI